MEDIFSKIYGLLAPEPIEHVLLHEGVVVQNKPPEYPLRISIGSVVPHSMKILAHVDGLIKGEKVLILSDDKYERFYLIGRIGREI